MYCAILLSVEYVQLWVCSAQRPILPHRTGQGVLRQLACCTDTGMLPRYAGASAVNSCCRMLKSVLPESICCTTTGWLLLTQIACSHTQVGQTLLQGSVRCFRVPGKARVCTVHPGLPSLWHCVPFSCLQVHLKKTQRKGDVQEQMLVTGPMSLLGYLGRCMKEQCLPLSSNV